MAEIISGLATHCYHDSLVAFVYNLDERIAYIKASKPIEEQALWLRLLKIIPDDRIPGKDSAEWQAVEQTGQAYSQARQAYDQKFRGELEALHKEICPDCPWDGKTIFTRKNKKGEWYYDVGGGHSQGGE